MQRSAWRRALVLCADFDETLSKQDTIHWLFDLANARQPNRHQREAHTACVNALVAQYSEDTARFLDQAFAQPKPQQAIETALDTFLDGYAAEDMRSLRRVLETGVLKGIHAQDVAALAEHIDLRPGWHSAARLADHFCVISSNWSADFVWQMLSARLEGSAIDMEVIANELEMDEQGVSTGGIRLVVQSPFDKADWVRTISKRLEAQTQQLPFTVFVGDSVNDLLAMKAADIALALSCSEKPTLMDTVASLFDVRLEVLPTNSVWTDVLAASSQAKAKGKQIIYEVKGWHEIETLLLSRE